MDLVDIDLKHKNKIEAIRLKAKVFTNAMSFYSCYIWKDVFGHKLYLTDDMYAITYNLKGQNAWYFPVGNDTAKKIFIDKLLQNDKLEFYKFTDEDKAFLESYYSNKFIYSECPDDSEYIYDTQEVCRMQGKKFAKLRSKCNSVLKQYDISIELVNDKNIYEAKAISQSWAKNRKKSGSSNTIGNEINDIIFYDYTKMEMQLFLMRMNKEAFAIIAGYELSSEIFDISMCQFLDNVKYMGYIAMVKIIQYMSALYKYVNLEEDLGIEGLRILKENIGFNKKINCWKAIKK